MKTVIMLTEVAMALSLGCSIASAQSVSAGSEEFQPA